jgi:hypothetical protein
MKDENASVFSHPLCLGYSSAMYHSISEKRYILLLAHSNPRVEKMSDIERERMRDAWGYLPAYTDYMSGAPSPDWMARGYGRRAPHLGHINHLCNMVERGVDIESYKRLVKGAKYICQNCGRAATKAENLCAPWPLNRKFGE